MAFTDEDKQFLADMENRIIEATRKMQTELLRGFDAFAAKKKAAK
jgi:hypothetical protein